jgi:nitroreductase
LTESGSIDWVLTTTRTVRRRLDLERPVDINLVLDCLDVALQAPTGGDLQRWRWIIIADPAIKTQVRDVYVEALDKASRGRRPTPGNSTGDRMLDDAWHLANQLHRVPVLVLACIEGRIRPHSTPAQAAALYGSIYPAVWSLQLALRSRGLVSAMTTAHLERHEAMADVLGIPDHVTQAALLPVAHLLGDDLHRARRRSVHEVAFADRWDGPWEGGPGATPADPG